MGSQNIVKSEKTIHNIQTLCMHATKSSNCLCKAACHVVSCSMFLFVFFTSIYTLLLRNGLRILFTIRGYQLWSLTSNVAAGEGSQTSALSPYCSAMGGQDTILCNVGLRETSVGKGKPKKNKVVNVKKD